MNKNLIIPLTVIIISVILGVAFYATTVFKEHSIEKQQEMKIDADKAAAQTQYDEQQTEQENQAVQQTAVTIAKSECVTSAKDQAVEQNTEECTIGSYDCIAGSDMYNVASYNQYYSDCLRSHGLE